MSVVGELGLGMYFPGKVMHCVISCFLASIFASSYYRIFSQALSIGVLLVATLVFLFMKKTVAFRKRLVYNVGKDCTGGLLCYSGKRLQNPAAIVPAERR